MTKEGGMIVKGGGASLFIADLVGMIYDVRWLLLFVVVCVIVDCKLGYEQAKIEGSYKGFSTCLRATINKLIDYLAYVIFAGVGGKTFAEPLGYSPLVTAVLVCLVIYVIELSSIVGHIGAIRGIDIDVIKLLKSLLKIKNKELSDAVEESVKVKKDDRQE